MSHKNKLRKFPFDDDSDDSSSGEQTSHERKVDVSGSKSSSSNIAESSEHENKKNHHVTFKEQITSDVRSEESSLGDASISPISKELVKVPRSKKVKPTLPPSVNDNLKSKKKKRKEASEDDEQSLLRAFAEFDSSSDLESDSNEKDPKHLVDRKVISYNSQGLPLQDSSSRTRFREIPDSDDEEPLSRKRAESTGDYFYESDEDTRYGPTKKFSFSSGFKSRMTFHQKRIVQYNQKYNGFGNMLSPFVRIIDDRVQNKTGPVKYFCLMCSSGPNRLQLKEVVDHLKTKCMRTHVQESESVKVDNALTVLAEHYDQYVDQANRRLRIQQDAHKLAEMKARRAHLLNRTAELVTESSMEKSLKNFQAIHSLLGKVMALKTQMGLRGKDLEAISTAGLSKRMRKYEAEDESDVEL